jgi:hypothetical protein
VFLSKDILRPFNNNSGGYVAHASQAENSVSTFHPGRGGGTAALTGAAPAVASATAPTGPTGTHPHPTGPTGTCPAVRGSADPTGIRPHQDPAAPTGPIRGTRLSLCVFVFILVILHTVEKKKSHVINITRLSR